MTHSTAKADKLVIRLYVFLLTLLLSLAVLLVAISRVWATGSEPAGTPNEGTSVTVYDEPDSGAFVNDLGDRWLRLVDFNHLPLAVSSGTEHVRDGIRFGSLAPEPLRIAPPDPAYYRHSRFLSVGAPPGVGGDSLNDSLIIEIPTGATAIGWTFIDVDVSVGESITFYDASGDILYSQPFLPQPEPASFTSFFGIVSETPVVRIRVLEAADDGDDIGYDNFIFAVLCGNAILEPEWGEQCDDGNGDPMDGCTHFCTICGDGEVAELEECDDGNLVDGDGCDADCSLTACGNGIVTGGEECDDGNLIEGDGCDSNCTATGCPNGIVSEGEECDDDNVRDGDGCDSNCTMTRCGNRVVTAGEQCDDGNADACDGCSPSCQFELGLVCGDRLVAPNCEICDDGNLLDGDGCDSNCTPTQCGNRITTAGEECDDGDDDRFDGCTNDCTVCGNSTVTEPEQCDDGNLINGDGCDADCTVALCGNEIVSASEECDDGNTNDGDGCDSDCSVTACGNGIVTDGEECDDGNAESCDGCHWCVVELGVACGDGTVNPRCGEECDDGNLVDGDGCDSDCSATACGNGVVTDGEECDDGNRVPFDGCTNECTICGDGVVTPPEECDDGNTDTSDGCTTGCTVCGDGIVTAPEGCDDGNLIDGDGCDADCIGPGCGNAQLEETEECDDGGLCIGGINAGQFCNAHSQCSEGQCTSFGGDGCAANCTEERDLVLDLVPGRVDGINVAPDTSGAEAVGAIINVPLPFTGRWTLTVGKQRPNTLGRMEIPVVIKAADPRRIQSGFVCACLRGVEAKTCGGTLFEPDGVTLAKDCTDGPAVCPANRPCAYVHGPGNVASGVIGCEALYAVNVDFIHDCNEEYAQPPHPAVMVLSGFGGAGSALLHSTTATGVVGGGCTGEGFDYGADGQYCTDDDPQAERGTTVTTPLTTGTATGMVLNADDFVGQTISAEVGPGLPFNCDALEAGSGGIGRLVGALALCDQEAIGDVAGVTTMAARPCPGDCAMDGAVTVDDLLISVNIALGNEPMSACAGGDMNGDDQVTVDEILSCVAIALEGCAGGR